MKSIVTGMFKNKLIAGVLMMALGVLLLAAPETAMNTTIRIIGVAFAAAAAAGVFVYFRSDRDRKPVFTLILSVLSAIVAAVFLFAPSFISGILPFIFGLILLTDSAGSLLASLTLPIGRIPCVLLSLVGVVLGVVVILDPNALSAFLTRLIGASLLFTGAIDITTAIVIKNNG